MYLLSFLSHLKSWNGTIAIIQMNLCFRTPGSLQDGKELERSPSPAVISHMWKLRSHDLNKIAMGQLTSTPGLSHIFQNTQSLSNHSPWFSTEWNLLRCNKIELFPSLRPEHSTPTPTHSTRQSRAPSPEPGGNSILDHLLTSRTPLWDRCYYPHFSMWKLKLREVNVLQLES